jgi:TPR repeat protein
MLRLAFCLSVALTFMPAMGSAQDFDAGQAAFDANDYATALREWEPLAEQGNARAQVKLGLMYRKGNGVPQDYAEAAIWYKKAAELGDAKGQVILGIAYSSGLGVPQDYAEAAKWYRKAAEQGDAGAQDLLGRMHARGEGLPQDYATAHMWLNLASGNGSAVSASLRDDLATKMTLGDVTEAQRRARVCLASNYQDCG